MTIHAYDQWITALLVIDPYTDFISEGGKIWDRFRAVAEANDCVRHMLQVINAAECQASSLLCPASSIPSGRPRDFEVHCARSKAAWMRKSFEYGTWGGEIRPGFVPKPGEIVAAEHWCSSEFANMDLDLQQPKKHGALDINLPKYASAIVNTQEIVASISALTDSHSSEATSMRIQQGIHR